MNSRKTVLLVDDIPTYLDTMELNLPEGCFAQRAESRSEAMVLLDLGEIAMAVVDIRLKDGDASNRDGLDLLKWIRERHPEVMVIMISAFREFEFEAESLALGAEFFLRKPIQPDEFRTIVAQMFDKP